MKQTIEKNDPDDAFAGMNYLKEKQTTGSILLSSEEKELLSIIRNSKNPGALLVYAVELITSLLKQPESYESPSSVDLLVTS